MQNNLEAEVRHAIDTKTKPPGSLGRIESLALRIALVQGTKNPALSGCSLTIIAADHGIANEGVSAFPQEVTGQMVLNFLAGGAASNVFANTFGVPVTVVDAGVAGEPLEHADLVSRRVGAGTASFLTGPAMTAEQCSYALKAGRELGTGSPGVVAAFGEMGIANTATATILAHKIAGLPLAGIVGRGTGLDDAGLSHKLDVLTRAASRTEARLDAETALREYGGFEIAMIAGAMCGAAESGRVVLVDGFIATVAALVAEGISPKARDAFVFAHMSAEAGHRAVLAHMNADPLLTLDMRLGEGTGALLAWPLLQASVAMLNDMASFESAGVSGKE